jgi:spoIIIJ-associated protein
LSALQHIAKILVSKQHPTYAFLNLDINSYRESRKNELAEIALQVAKRVRRTKKTVVLEPMPAFERRIIHLKLAEQPDIITESIGQEPERRIMVRLYP